MAGHGFPCPGWLGDGRALRLTTIARPSFQFHDQVGFGEFVMRSSPSIAPQGRDQDTYLVLDDFGRIGRAWRETGEDAADRETLIRNLLSGEYSNPVRIIAFNILGGWSRDVTVEIADEVRLLWAESDVVPNSILQFTEANRR